MIGKSIFDKLWDRHVITGVEGQPQLMYVDQHYIHEVTSPQAFQGLRDAGRKVRRPDLTFGTFDHNVPTVNIFDIRDVISKAQIDKLAENVVDFGIEDVYKRQLLDSGEFPCSIHPGMKPSNPIFQKGIFTRSITL